MLRAISLGIRHLEFDVRMTADNEIVLFHDENLYVNGNTTSVATTAYPVMKQLYPTMERLSEFLHAILSATTSDMDLTFVVDVKTNHRDVNFADELMRTLMRTLMHTLMHTSHDTELKFANANTNISFVITSFDHPLICSIQRMIRIGGLAWECGVLVYHVPTAEELATYPCAWVGFDNNTLTEPVVKDAHSAGKKVFVYTPNDTDEFDRCVAMGVDGIYTDDVKLWNDHTNR
jgi:glycerophosphoryl diester phosphodiesterase